MDYEQINIIRKYPFTEMAYLTSFLDNGIVNPININKLKTISYSAVLICLSSIEVIYNLFIKNIQNSVSA